MADHPIQGLMQTAMENIKEMVDVNTIVGEPVETPDGSVILPISRVGFGFAAGGSDFNIEDGHDKSASGTSEHGKARPFGGGSGGGVSINPIAFLVVGKPGVHIVPLDNQTHLVEKIIDSVPGVIDRIQSMFPNQHATGTSMATAHAAQNGMQESAARNGINPFS
ncbi:GerW family sporulation protein [Paenibacillus sp.]|uniref:GerW family sporulation protein n=1 Tax=Paenibacillus sp. TaxID=58172 RepID=UPI0015A8D61E|nr:GerW family sporulation protein [Paenibacillus sp.]MDU2242756.1 GerW family sporulation protein [Paenibacillus sp.]GJM80037.1 putative spore protein YtfJ [Paenibacillus sp. HMSSN-139]